MREAASKRAEARKIALQPGMILELYGVAYTIVSPYRGSWWLIRRCEDGQLFRARATELRKVALEARANQALVA